MAKLTQTKVVIGIALIFIIFTLVNDNQGRKGLVNFPTQAECQAYVSTLMSSSSCWCINKNMVGCTYIDTGLYYLDTVSSTSPSSYCSNTVFQCNSKCGCGGSSCTSACTNGATQCTSTSTVQTCRDTNGDGCYEWSSAASCSTSTPICTNNKCVQCTTNSDCNFLNPYCSSNKCVSTPTVCSLSNPSACPQVGSACIDSFTLCTSAFIYNGYYYCNIDDTVCGLGCTGNVGNAKCVIPSVCNENYMICNGQQAQKCTNGTWVNSGSACISPQVCVEQTYNYAYCNQPQKWCYTSTGNDCSYTSTYSTSTLCYNTSEQCGVNIWYYCLNTAKTACTRRTGSCLSGEQTYKGSTESTVLGQCNAQTNKCDNDGVCDSGETYSTCLNDCHCGNGVCDYSETYTSCSSDCSAPSVCNNDGICGFLETATNCINDCHCGNKICDHGETIYTCAGDCPQAPTCNNNGGCDAGETFTSCAADCHCGNGICDYSETSSSCASDCPVTESCIKGEVAPACDGKINAAELNDYVRLWLKGSAALSDLKDVVNKYLTG